MECNQNCQSCSASCNNRPVCPLCLRPGLEVPNITVVSLANIVTKLDCDYYLCVSPQCDCVYYTENNEVINTKEVKKPVWFKAKYLEYIVCYCRNIYLKDVVKACFDLKGEIDLNRLLVKLNKDKIIPNCIINNPTGKSCENLLDNALSYAKNLYLQKERNQSNEN